MRLLRIGFLCIVMSLYAALAGAQVPDHLNIVQRVRSQSPPDTSSAAGILQFLVRVICALPPHEQAGLHAKPGGENIAFYMPAGKMVGISRVMYPDGSLVKVLTDAGPGGANGAGWAHEDPIDPARYVPVSSAICGGPPPAPPVPVADLQPILDTLDALTNELAVLAAKVEQHQAETEARLQSEETERVSRDTGLGQQLDELAARVFVVESRLIPQRCVVRVYGLRLGCTLE